LIVNSEYPPVGGGAGNASANIAGEFVRLGEEVAVLTTRYQGLPVDEVDDGIRIHRCLSIRKEASRSNPWEQLSFLLGACTDGLLFVKKWKPDVLITFFGVPSGPVGLLAKTFFKIPYIVSLRGGDVPGFRPYDFSTYHKLISPLLRIVWRKADHVVANSEGLKDLAQEFALHVPISVIPNGVDTSFFQPKDTYTSKPHMLFVGRVVYQKGLDLIIKALSRLLDHEWEFTIVGDGPKRESLTKLTRSYDIDHRVHFLGWKSRSELRKIYQKANIFVFPSRHEGMPNVILEAMASGLATIASKIAGNEELIIHGKTGYLFERNNISALSKNIIRMLEDDKLRREMGISARKRAVNVFSWENTATQYWNLFNEIKGAE
jgi:glycosyltransferase involved in cell wall biosynthesis